MSNLKTVSTWLPVFTGFYESIFDGSDLAIESETQLSIDEYKEYYEELHNAGISQDYFNDNIWGFINFSDCFKEASKSICNALPNLDHAGIIKGVEFESLQSPKYYNFSTDSINCKITFDTELLTKYINDNLEAFTEYIKDRYTSRSGFISSYSNNVNDWLDVNEYGEHEAGAVLQFVIYNEYGSEYSAVEDLYYESNCYEDFYNYEFDYKGMIKAYKESITNTVNKG